MCVCIYIYIVLQHELGPAAHVPRYEGEEGERNNARHKNGRDSVGNKLDGRLRCLYIHIYIEILSATSWMGALDAYTHIYIYI